MFPKEVVFKGFEGTKVIFRGDRKILPTCLISAVKARKLLSKGCSAYLAHVVDTQASKLRPEDIPVIREFLDVFPEELLGLLPDREVEFSIDLIPWTAPISQTPYRIALKELKVHLQELIDKGYVRSELATI